MFEEHLEQQNRHWTGNHYDTGVPRSCFQAMLDFYETGQVVAVTGVRRAGKSTLVRQLMEHLIAHENVPAHNILFLNLEHPYLAPYREEGLLLQRLYEEYLNLIKPDGPVVVCLDEVQFFREWPIFVKAHHETKDARFVVTGSNAAMLSTDLMTLLSGRSLPLEVFPFSLRELAQGRGSPSGQRHESGKLLEEMLEYGGFPTVAMQPAYTTAYDILGAHARTVLLQDVAPRLGIRKPRDLEKLYVYLVSHISRLSSYASLSKLFALSDKSIKEYIQALSDAHLLYEVDHFSYSLKKQIRTPKKIYAIDTGQANAMGFQFSANRGRLLENLIFLDLMRMGVHAYYYKTADGREIDFVVQDRSQLCLVQVAWDVHDPATYQREAQGLRVAMEELGCDRAHLLVADPPLKQEASGDGIEVKVAADFLLKPLKERKELLLGSQG